jgi:hypothetical protein
MTAPAQLKHGVASSCHQGAGDVSRGPETACNYLAFLGAAFAAGVTVVSIQPKETVLHLLLLGVE